MEKLISVPSSATQDSRHSSQQNIINLNQFRPRVVRDAFPKIFTAVSNDSDKSTNVNNQVLLDDVMSAMASLIPKNSPISQKPPQSFAPSINSITSEPILAEHGFAIIKKLGEGSYSKVMLANHLLTDKKVFYSYFVFSECVVTSSHYLVFI